MVFVFQPHHDPFLNYLQLSKIVNQKACDKLGYKYVFTHINPGSRFYYFDNHDFTGLSDYTSIKLFAINDILYENDDEDGIFIFLYPNAWIQNLHSLDNVIKTLKNNKEKHGCFSREPNVYGSDTTFINSGSFILKINDYTKAMFLDIIRNNFIENKKHQNEWPFEQFYISDFVHKHKDDFYIFDSNVLNTPNGTIIRNNWFKNDKMFNDMNYIIRNDFADSKNLELYYLKKINETINNLKLTIEKKIRDDNTYDEKMRDLQKNIDNIMERLIPSVVICPENFEKLLDKNTPFPCLDNQSECPWNDWETGKQL